MPSEKNRISHFEPYELFFSRTKRNGVILSGNATFARVSKYPMDQMLNRAHSMIRHPDMPRAVFKYMWDEILAGRMITAYVKNKASDGSYYWVLATVCPHEKDFVSIRIKPTSEWLSQHVEPLYKKLLSAEKDHNLDEQVKAMLAEIKSLGFEGYQHFMQAALEQELSLIKASLLEQKHSADGFSQVLGTVQASMADLLEVFNKTSKSVSNLQETLKLLTKSTKAQELLPFNLTLSTQKSKVTQKTMEILSDLFSQQQKEVVSFIKDFESVIADAESKGLRPLRYDISLCFMQITAVLQFLGEIESKDINEKFKLQKDIAFSECRDLIKLTSMQFEKTLQNINDLRSRFIKILSKKDEMATLVKSVLSISQLGQVEISQDPQAKDAALPHLMEMKKMAVDLGEKIESIGQKLNEASGNLSNASGHIIKGNKKCVQVQLLVEKHMRVAEAA